jgi:hypothetical protein
MAYIARFYSALANVDDLAAHDEKVAVLLGIRDIGLGEQAVEQFGSGSS